MAKNVNIGGRLHSTATGNIVTGANEVYDDDKGKKQSEINSEIHNYVENINNALENLSPEQQEALDVAEKTNNNEAKLGYYVCGTESNVAAKVVSNARGYILGAGGSIKIKMTNTNTADNVTLNINSTGAKPLYYDGERASANNSWEEGETVEVYYDGTSYYANNVAGGSSDGVFDVSVKYPTSGIDGGNTYTLEGALAVLNANLSSNKKKGGMSIKFIQSSDNKYVQYRLTAKEWSINTKDWAIVDNGTYIEHPEFVYVKTDAEGKILWAIKTNGSIYYGAGCPQQVKDYIEEKISSLSLDEYGDIVAFLNDYLRSDTTLKVMIDGINVQIATKLDAEGLCQEALRTLQAVENPEYIQVTTDSESKILEGITSEGAKQINIPIDTPSFTIEHKNNNDWLYVVIDSECKILEGIKKDGKKYKALPDNQDLILKEHIDKIREKISGYSNAVYFPFIYSNTAWDNSEKKNAYESWPFANCFYDKSTGDICVVINEREKHADTNNTGTVWFRKKKEEGNFGEWILVADNLDGIGKRTHATGICANGDYISFIIFQEVGGNGLDGTIHVFRSTDKGDTWIDEGEIIIDNTPLQSDQVCGLFLSSSGRLITASHKGSNIGTNNTFVMYSDDNGHTWVKANSDVMNLNDQECSWCEIGNTLFMVTRRGLPYLYYSDNNGEDWNYSGRFNFPNYDSPTSITKLPNGKYLIVGGSREVTKNGKCRIIASVVESTFFTKDHSTEIAPISLVKFSNVGSSDYSYTQVVLTESGMLYCYYYDRNVNLPGVSYQELKGTILGL